MCVVTFILLSNIIWIPSFERLSSITATFQCSYCQEDMKDGNENIDISISVILIWTSVVFEYNKIVRKFLFLSVWWRRASEIISCRQSARKRAIQHPPKFLIKSAAPFPNWLTRFLISDVEWMTSINRFRVCFPACALFLFFRKWIFHSAFS